jgi:hypothetical protein
MFETIKLKRAFRPALTDTAAHNMHAASELMCARSGFSNYGHEYGPAAVWLINSATLIAKVITWRHVPMR